MRPYNQHTEWVESWLQRAPVDHQELLNEVRDFILSFDERIEEYYKYKLPMYSIKKNICYLHVDSKTQKPYIGFLNGKIMQERFPETSRFLVGESQKRVRQYWLSKELNVDHLGLLLNIAMELDSTL